MRISDLNLSNSYLSNLNNTKANISKLRDQIATQKKISNPSDSPSGTSSLIRISSQIENTQAYINGIKKGLSFLNESLFVMENISTEISNVLTKLTELGNPIVQTNYDLYSQQIDKSLSIILDVANSQSDGKYILGGTDFSKKPFDINPDTGKLNYLTDTSGEHRIKIAPNVLQRINITGKELFETIVIQNGNFDTAAVDGSVINSSAKVYDASGAEYNMQSTYTKTGANKYQLSYDITDSDGNSVFTSSPAAKELVFNEVNGELKSIDGSSPSYASISVPGKSINFSLDIRSLKEKAEPASISSSANQKTDIFSTLIAMRDNLKNGIPPTQEQTNIVQEFSKKLLDKISITGATYNQLSNSEEMLNNQLFNFQKMASDENDIDLAKAIIDLQQQDYVLQLSNKVAAMILPKTLMDYL